MTVLHFLMFFAEELQNNHASDKLEMQKCFIEGLQLFAGNYKRIHNVAQKYASLYFLILYVTTLA